MTVRLDNEGVIILTGECPVEDAEALLEQLQARRHAPVDWSGCTVLHTAVLQILMAARPKLLGECGDGFVRTWTAIAPRDGVAGKGPTAAGDRKSGS